MPGLCFHRCLGQHQPGVYGRGTPVAIDGSLDADPNSCIGPEQAKNEHWSRVYVVAVVIEKDKLYPSRNPGAFKSNIKTRTLASDSFQYFEDVMRFFSGYQAEESKIKGSRRVRYLVNDMQNGIEYQFSTLREIEHSQDLEKRSRRSSMDARIVERVPEQTALSRPRHVGVAAECGQFSVTSLQIWQDRDYDEFAARARITNQGPPTEYVEIALTLLAGDEIVGVLSGAFASIWTTGRTVTMSFHSDDTYTEYSLVDAQVEHISPAE